MSAETNTSSSVLSALVPFAIGGISGAVATMVIQPIDTLKVQVQIVSEQLGKSSRKQHGIFQIINRIRADKGLGVLYRGLDSAILRQLFYASARLGAYDASIQRL